MQRATTALLTGLGGLLVAGCKDSSDPTTLESQFDLALTDTSTALIGNVVNADSLPLARSQVLLYLVGVIPPDSTPPDSTPPDSTPPDTTSSSPVAYAMPVALFRRDSIPGDSTPPPPPTRCGDRGQLVGRRQTNRNGFFQVLGLAPGIYDVRAGARGRQGAACGAILREGQQVFVTIMVTAGTRGGVSSEADREP